MIFVRLVISCSTDLIISDQNEEVKDEIPQTSVENNDNPEPFIPTHEWQVVKENQAIPAGLHVRMNFQTGIKEAKILEDDKKVKKQHDKDETIDNKVKVGNQENVEVKTPKIIISKESEPISAFEKSDDKVYFTKSDLKEALNEFRDKVGTKDVHEMHWSDDNHDDRQGDNHDDILSKVVPDASGILLSLKLCGHNSRKNIDPNIFHTFVQCLQRGRRTNFRVITK